MATGQSGNPAGRPKGSRNKVSERFLEALAKHFEANGEAAIDTVYKERPHEYLKLVASVLPKRMELADAIAQKPAPGGNMYINVHTAKYPDGEIRGQLTPAS